MNLCVNVSRSMVQNYPVSSPGVASTKHKNENYTSNKHNRYQSKYLYSLNPSQSCQLISHLHKVSFLGYLLFMSIFTS